MAQRKRPRRTGGRKKKKKRRDFDFAEEKRDDHIKLEGVVTNVFAGGQFEIETDAGVVELDVIDPEEEEISISVVWRISPAERPIRIS